MQIVDMMNSTHKNEKLLSIAFSGAEEPDFLVAKQGKISIENYEN
jgi:hypothetical protein